MLIFLLSQPRSKAILITRFKNALSKNFFGLVWCQSYSWTWKKNEKLGLGSNWERHFQKLNWILHHKGTEKSFTTEIAHLLLILTQQNSHYFHPRIFHPIRIRSTKTIFFTNVVSTQQGMSALQSLKMSKTIRVVVKFSKNWVRESFELI